MKSLYCESILEGIIMEKKTNHNTMVKCERSYDSLVDNKMSSKALMEEKAKSSL